MSLLIKNWHEYCQGEKFFDKSHFFSLLRECSSLSELKGILSYFPNSEVLLARVQDVLCSGDFSHSAYLLPLEKNKASVIDLILAGLAWLKEQKRFCRLMGDEELYKITSNAEVVYVSREEVDRNLKKDIPNNWVFELIGDQVRSTKIVSSDPVYALFEAMYGLAADYYLAWYMGKALFNLDMDFDDYYNFWRIGGFGVLTQDRFLVTHSI